MNIEKVLNNNLVISLNESGKEIILRGKGIGFQKKRGDLIDPSTIERIYTPTDKKESQRFQQLFSDISMKYLAMAEKVVEYARNNSGLEVSDSILLPLSDHIAGAVERHELKIQLNNPILWDVNRLYPTEFEVGKKAVELMEQQLGILLPEEEAALIAFHFVNAQFKSSTIVDVMPVSQIILDILDIVQMSFQIELDEKDWNYQRFVTHLKFFIQRMLKGERTEEQSDEWFQIIKKEHPHTYQCIVKIADYIHDTNGYELNREEMLYLMLHIERLTRRVT